MDMHLLMLYAEFPIFLVMLTVFILAQIATGTSTTRATPTTTTTATTTTTTATSTTTSTTGRGRRGERRRTRAPSPIPGLQVWPEGALSWWQCHKPFFSSMTIMLITFTRV